MKIGVYIPVGPLTSLSYQYNYETVLKCLSSTFKHVVLVSSSRKTTAETISHLELNNINVISNELTWGNLDENGVEIANFTKNNIKYNFAKSYLIKEGCDIFLHGDINMYITNEQYSKLEIYCESILKNNELIGWRYRSLQILDKFTVPNMRHPWIHNLNHPDSSKLSLKPDETHLNEIKYRAERGNFYDAPFYFYDIFPPMLTEKDYYEKFEYYIKHVNVYYNKSGKGYDCHWFDYIEREYNKFKGSEMMEVTLDKWGKEILKNMPDNNIYEYFKLLESGYFGKLKYKYYKWKYDKYNKEKN